jgi:PAS domain S-box-containing protein
VSALSIQKIKQFFDKISLRGKLIAAGISAVVIPFVVTGVIINIQLTSSLSTITKEKSVQIAKDLAVLLDTALSQELKLVSVIASNRNIINSAKTGNYSLSHKELQQIYTIIGTDYLSFFITDGISHVDLPEGKRLNMDLSDRGYFIKAKSGLPNISDPIIARGPDSSKLTGAPILVTAAPIMDGEKFLGIVAITHQLSSIKKIMSGVRIGETGYPFITDATGLVIMHPNREYELKINMNNESGMEDILRRILKREAGAERYNFRGTEKITGFAPLNITGWNVLFTQNKSEIMKPAGEILLLISLIGIAVILAAISVIIIFSKKISSPVQKLMDIMRQITIHSGEIIAGIGLDRKLIFVNSAAEKLFGRASEELIGSDFIFRDIKRADTDSVWISLATGESWSGRVAFDSTTHGEATLAMIIIPVKDDGGYVQSYLAIGRDITGELMLEKRMLQSQRMESIGTMAGGIAHDFNNILAGIFGYLDLSLRSVGNPEKVEAYLHEIQKASNRARDLVNRILTFSRQTKVEPKTVVPKNILSEVVKLLRASTPAEIEIQITIESGSAITADPTQIHQLMVNLCTNAVHAIGANPGTVKIDLEVIIVDDEFASAHPGLKSGKHIILRVSDTGCGIKPEIIDHIFDPFFTTKKQGEGTGLGLSVVHGIINSIGGIITVYSEHEKGTVFSVILPVTDTEGNCFENEDYKLKCGNERIMLVDDEKAIADSCQHILTNLGYCVTVFTESGEALAAFKRDINGFDLILTDHSMPCMTGLEMSKHVKTLNPQIPILLMSGYINKTIEEEAANSGDFALLKKPVSTFELADAIRRALEKR